MQEQNPQVTDQDIINERQSLVTQVREFKRNKFRLTIIGGTGAGKTHFDATSEAVLNSTDVKLPAHAGACGGHGNRYVCQRQYSAKLDEQVQVTIQSTDLKGIAFDGTENRSMIIIAEEAKNIFAGIYPQDLHNRPRVADMLQDPIEEHQQDGLIIVFGADSLSDDNAKTCLSTIAGHLSCFHLPFFIVLTKCDLLPHYDEAIETLVTLTGRTRAFIYPVSNVTSHNARPSRDTTFQVLRIYSELFLPCPLPPHVPT